jgi:hypothetical protein
LVYHNRGELKERKMSDLDCLPCKLKKILRLH